MSMPLSFLVLWLAGLLSLALLGAGAYLVWAWYVGEIVETVWLAVGVALLLWSVSGRWFVLLTRRRGADEPRSGRGGRHRRVAGPDGADLHVEEHGPEGGAAPTLPMTHGWDLDATAWYYEKKNLADHFRLVLWDLPGLGLSTHSPRTAATAWGAWPATCGPCSTPPPGAGRWCWSGTASGA